MLDSHYGSAAARSGKSHVAHQSAGDLPVSFRVMFC